ncbi:HpcH/HpaI aldolase family protein [Variovorax arabinosiphilus]|uniref:HpcH/HpaI aldolase family protein n=1 Tax=Variovorax arabinosiphilus TaxID=3053498 RepID=UPI0025774603|nr:MULTISPECIES: aldolase/citrate lyase family protein [unclassified Variovorax]MDM0120206.1 aldolase/citrate lyase family protein [Variovorax sp. J2L1-78]MDM0127882.1 aldolase/citrate lyase family protein [Variovorax sp. J2L1-63]MDM0231581.1 aldolase/citrate lyase family protein [Variovorax sp. J2R1-6]
MNAQHPIDTRLPEMLRSGRLLRGVFNGIPSPAIVEMCAFAGFDFVLLDNEHGSAGLETTEHMLRAARASGIPTVVRCLEQDMARTLDLGASAVQIPMVDTAAHAASLVQRVKYPTRGQPGLRGAAFSTRAAGYGAFGGTAHTALSNDGVALIVMIETPEGVANAAAIAAVSGVDAVFVGPNDLAHSMGFDNRWNEAPVQAAIESALRAVAAAGKCPGILALTPEEEARYAAWGARYVASNTAGILLKALRDVARQGR